MDFIKRIEYYKFFQIVSSSRRKFSNIEFFHFPMNLGFQIIRFINSLFSLLFSFIFSKFFFLSSNLYLLSSYSITIFYPLIFNFDRCSIIIQPINAIFHTSSKSFFFQKFPKIPLYSIYIFHLLIQFKFN